MWVNAHLRVYKSNNKTCRTHGLWVEWAHEISSHVLHIIVLELISFHVCFKTLVLISFKSITSNINYIHVSKNSKTKSQLHTLVALIPWLNSPAIFMEERSAIWARAYWKNIRHFAVKCAKLTILQGVHCLKLTLQILHCF